MHHSRSRVVKRQKFDAPPPCGIPDPVPTGPRYAASLTRMRTKNCVGTCRLRKGRSCQHAGSDICPPSAFSDVCGQSSRGNRSQLSLTSLPTSARNATASRDRSPWR